MATLERDIMDRKTISVSKKRQITIPLQFYKHLDLDNEVECSLEDGAIVIRPVHRGTSEFSVELQNKNIKTAVSNMIEEADAIAAGEKSAANLNDVFGSEN